MKKTQLVRLQSLVRDMQKKRESLIIFPFDFWGRRFSCLMIMAEGIRLFITIVGAERLSVEFTINEDCCVPNFVKHEDYLSLLEILDIRRNCGGYFKPVEFFEALDRMAPTSFVQNRRSDAIPVKSKRNNKEKGRPYFVGWTRNPSRHCTDENARLTREAFPTELAELAISHGVSSCWSKYRDREKLAFINDLICKLS